MRRRSAAPPPDPHADTWVRDTSRAGETVGIKGERGTYRIVEQVLTEAGAEWFQLFGGAPGHGAYRFIHPDRIRWPKAKRTKETKA